MGQLEGSIVLTWHPELRAGANLYLDGCGEAVDGMYIVNRAEQRFGSDGYETELDIAANPSEATKRIADRPFDLVIADVAALESDGATADDALRAISRQPSGAIVVLQSNPSDEDQKALEAAGANWVVRKPISADRLLVELNLAYSRYVLNSAPRTQAESVAS
jgi:CheY-like chemotaxis protein